MAKPRRNIQFQHRGSNAHDVRRLSVSEVSEGPSEPGSPVKGGMNGKVELSTEEVYSAPLRPAFMFGMDAATCGWHHKARWLTLTIANGSS